MTTVVSILMSDIVPLRDRGVWQGIINIIYATGAGTGAPLGKELRVLDEKDGPLAEVAVYQAVFWPTTLAGVGMSFWLQTFLVQC